MADLYPAHCSGHQVLPNSSFDLLFRARRCVCRAACKVECTDASRDP
jgi:hypothetical protein